MKLICFLPKSCFLNKFFNSFIKPQKGWGVKKGNGEVVDMKKTIKFFIGLNLCIAEVIASSKNFASQRIDARNEQALQHHLDRHSPRVGRSLSQKELGQRAKPASVATPQNLSNSVQSLESLRSDSSTGQTDQTSFVNSSESDRLSSTDAPIALMDATLLETPRIPDVERENDIVVDPILLNMSETSPVRLGMVKPDLVKQHYSHQEMSSNDYLSPIEELALSAVDSKQLEEGLTVSDIGSNSSDDELELVSFSANILSGYKLFIEHKPLSWLEEEKQYLILRTNELASLFHEKIRDSSLARNQKMQILSEIGSLRRLVSVFLQATQGMIAQKLYQQKVKDLQIKRLQEKQERFGHRSFFDKFMSGATLSY